MSPLVALDALLGSSGTVVVLTLLATAVLFTAAGPVLAYRHWCAGRIVSATRVATHASWSAYALLWVGILIAAAFLAGYVRVVHA